PGVGFRPDGSLTIVQTAEQLAVIEQVAARDDADARGVRVLDGNGVRAINPAIRADVLAGLHCTLDAVVEPRRALPALREWLSSTGDYTFVGGRSVVMFEPEGAAVDDSGTRHVGDLVIACTGASFDLLGNGAATVPPPLRRCQLQMLQTEPLGERL